jgi:predicted metal-dependent hydrolase
MAASRTSNSWPWSKVSNLKSRAFSVPAPIASAANHRAGYIRLNTELVKKPKDLLEYVIVHEMAHLIEPTHSARFIAILDRHYPSWREARAELNELPLTAEVWKA